jgi:hypothetical protein
MHPGSLFLGFSLFEFSYSSNTCDLRTTNRIEGGRTESRTHGKQQRGDGQAYENSKKVKPGCDIIKEHVTRILVDPCENRCRNGTMRASRSSKLYLLFDSATTSSLIWKISHKSGKSEMKTRTINYLSSFQKNQIQFF